MPNPWIMVADRQRLLTFFKIIAVIFHQIGLKDLQFHTHIYNEKTLVHPKSSKDEGSLLCFIPFEKYCLLNACLSEGK